MGARRDKRKQADDLAIMNVALNGKTVPMHHLGYIIGPQIEQVWPHVVELVAAACDVTLTPADVLASISERRACMWLVEDVDGEILACMVTRVASNGDRRWLEVLTIAGSGWASWIAEIQAALERYAEQERCECIRATCRPGLERWMNEIGWRKRQIIMECPING